MLGSFKLPDIERPASIPVTAGKKTAKTFQKDSLGKSETLETIGVNSNIPKKKEANDNKIKTNIAVCTFIAIYSINLAMMDALESLAPKRGNIHITHQTGESDYEMVKQKYGTSDLSHDIRPFIDDMAEQYRKASLVVCRAGATTLAEVTACGKVSVLIPYPHAAHNHQEKNAQILNSANAGEMVLDSELSGPRIAQSIIGAMEDPERLKEMEKNSYQLGNRDATEKVRQICMELLEDANGKSGRAGKTQGEYVLSCF